MTDEPEQSDEPATPEAAPVGMVEVEVVTIDIVPVPDDENSRQVPAAAPLPAFPADADGDALGWERSVYIGHQAKGEIEGEPPDIEE